MSGMTRITKNSVEQDIIRAGSAMSGRSDPSFHQSLVVHAPLQVSPEGFRGNVLSLPRHSNGTESPSDWVRYLFFGFCSIRVSRGTILFLVLREVPDALDPRAADYSGSSSPSFPIFLHRLQRSV
jgi:hypothetical protein